jgi:hypothetical protein
MVTTLQKPLKRELRLNDRTFVLMISPEALKLTLKGHRKGYELKWEDLISGEAALATALNASIGKFAQGNSKGSHPAVPAVARKVRPRKR